MKLGEIVKNYRSQHKLSMEKFAELANLSKGYISMLEKGENPQTKKPISPALETIQNIAKAMNIDFDLLVAQLDNNQPISLNTPPQATDSLLTAINDTVVQLTTERKKNVLDYSTELLDAQKTADPTINEPQATYYTYDYYDHPASAGTGQYLNDVQVEQIELPVNIDADFVVPIYGDSMEPEYHSGDYVFVKLSVNLASGDIGVFDFCGDAYIKQIFIEGNRAYLHSLNTKYHDIPVNSDSDFRIIGEVVGKYSENKKS